MSQTMTVFSLALAVANLVSSGDKTHNFTAAECPMSVETEYHTDRTSGPMGTIFCCFLKLPFDAGISSSKVSSAQLLLNCLTQKVSLNFLGGVSNAVAGTFFADSTALGHSGFGVGCGFLMMFFCRLLDCWGAPHR